jgi:hypothetical protein
MQLRSTHAHTTMHMDALMQDTNSTTLARVYENAMRTGLGQCAPRHVASRYIESTSRDAYTTVSSAYMGNTAVSLDALAAVDHAVRAVPLGEVDVVAWDYTGRVTCTWSPRPLPGAASGTAAGAVVPMDATAAAADGRTRTDNDPDRPGPTKRGRVDPDAFAVAASVPSSRPLTTPRADGLLGFISRAQARIADALPVLGVSAATVRGASSVAASPAASSAATSAWEMDVRKRLSFSPCNILPSHTDAIVRLVCHLRQMGRNGDVCVVVSRRAHRAEACYCLDVRAQGFTTHSVAQLQAFMYWARDALSPCALSMSVRGCGTSEDPDERCILLSVSVFWCPVSACRALVGIQ